MEKLIFDENYWQSRYLSNRTGWDVGQPTTPLKTYFDQLTDKSLKILIPGCGNAYEAEYVFNLGFKHVFLVDIAEQPLTDFKKRVPAFPDNQLLHQDFFTLTDTFDLIIEQTFFCALDPALRPAYARQCHQLLNPGGKLVGLLFDIEFENKTEPPFGGSKAEYETIFKPFFHFVHFEPSYNSIPPRQGKELFICLQKK